MVYRTGGKYVGTSLYMLIERKLLRNWTKRQSIPVSGAHGERENHCWLTNLPFGMTKQYRWRRYVLWTQPFI